MQGLAQLQRQKYELQACQSGQHQKQRQLEELGVQWRPELAQLPGEKDAAEVDITAGGLRTNAGSSQGELNVIPGSSAAGLAPETEAAVGASGRGFAAHNGMMTFDVENATDLHLERLLQGVSAGEHRGVENRDSQAFAPSAPPLEVDDYDAVDWGDPDTAGTVLAGLLGEDRHQERSEELTREAPGAPQPLPATRPEAASGEGSAAAGSHKQEIDEPWERSGNSQEAPETLGHESKGQPSTAVTQAGAESLSAAYAAQVASRAAKDEPVQERNGSGARASLADVVELSSSSSSSLFHTGSDADADVVDSKPKAGQTQVNGLHGQPGSKRRKVSQDGVAASGPLDAKQQRRGLEAKSADEDDVVVVGQQAGQGRRQRQAQNQAPMKGEKVETRPGLTSSGPGLSSEEQRRQRALMAQPAQQQALHHALQQQHQQPGWHLSQEEQEHLLMQQQQQLLLQQHQQQQQLMLQQMGLQHNPQAQGAIAVQPGQYHFPSPLSQISRALSSRSAAFRSPPPLPSAAHAGNERALVPLPRSHGVPHEQEAYTSVIEVRHCSQALIGDCCRLMSYTTEAKPLRMFLQVKPSLTLLLGNLCLACHRA